jgi:ATP-dependent helicase/nuclease subunit B
MKSFLEKVAEHLIEHYPDQISDVCIVLSNRRASLFLRKHLAERLGKTIWAPNIFSIEDFIDDLSDFESINSLTSTFELYEVHKQIEGKDAQTFDEFYKWGSILIQDFNELDLHLVDAENLYNYLSEIKSLADWNLEIEELSAFQTNYLKFFKSLKEYYLLLNKRLNQKKLAYNGKLFRSVAEDIHDKSKTLKWKQIIFAGFNALSLSEEKIFFTLKELDLAEFLWDVDDYYLSHANATVKHEAGLFFRRYFKDLKKNEINWLENHFEKDHKNIQIFGIPKQIGQAKYCGQLLKQDQNILSAQHKSAIILADENLLSPVLNSIPENYDELNVTMGLPLSSSPLFSFFNQLIKLQLYSENLKNSNNVKEAQFRYTDLVKLLRHSVINNIEKQLFSDIKNSPKQKLKEVKLRGQYEFTESEIQKAFGSEIKDTRFLKLIFGDWKDDPKQAIKNIQDIIEDLRDASLEKQITEQIDLKIEIELLYQFSILINHIDRYLKEYQSITNLKILHSIFIQVCNTQKLPLFGEPLKGLQLMGMLESRNLDFENLIILSVNENILPSSGKQISFIPFELKREFNIPTYREKNAIFAYHFFRLLQRSKNISLIYNSQHDPIAGGDKSRFIHQIIDELAVFNPNIKVSEKTVSSSIKLEKEPIISIAKNEAVIKKLDAYAEKGISASSLNVYIKCQLQFYFKNIAKLGEPEEITDSIDQATLGTVIHEALNEFYKPFINKMLQADELKLKLKNADHYISEAFRKHYHAGNTQYGKNLLIVNVAQEFFKNFIKYEIDDLSSPRGIKKEKIIKSLENRYETSLKVKSENWSKNIKLKGFIDRMQISNKQLEVIDYKTGAVNSYDLKLKSWDDLITNKKYDKVFQLLLYAWLVKKGEPNVQNLISGIYPLKKISNGFLNIQLPDQTGNTIGEHDLKEFEIELSKLLINIYNPQQKFTQTEDPTICKYCSYRSICNK